MLFQISIQKSMGIGKKTGFPFKTQSRGTAPLITQTIFIKNIVNDEQLLLTLLRVGEGRTTCLNTLAPKVGETFLPLCRSLPPEFVAQKGSLQVRISQLS